MVIGVGNEERRDDAAGPATARLLRSRAPGGARVVTCAGGAAELLEAWEGEPAVIVVDAMSSGAPPGTVRRFDALTEPPPPGPPGGSTHGLGLAEAVGLARALDRLPHRLVILGIEGEDFSPGTGLSPAVAAGVETAARLALEEIAAAER